MSEVEQKNNKICEFHLEGSVPFFIRTGQPNHYIREHSCLSGLTCRINQRINILRCFGVKGLLRTLLNHRFDRLVRTNGRFPVSTLSLSTRSTIEFQISFLSYNCTFCSERTNHIFE